MTNHAFNPPSLSLIPRARIPEEAASILCPEALQFLAILQQQFGARIGALLGKRKERQALLDQGEQLNFLSETAHIRDAQWKVGPLPPDLLNRQVEITGPVSRNMIINALNSGAQVFMADFEDSSSPTWDNMVLGQKHLRDAVFRQIDYFDENKQKAYKLSDHPAVLMVRPRGLHLPEMHITLDDKPISAALMDFGLYFFHNAKRLVENQSGPYFYLPKLESHLEARLWNDIFVMAQDTLGIPQGTIKATVLIETLPAAFEMDEILYELKDHAAGLNCGRWDYIFSFLKVHRERSDAILPDRSEVGMTQPCMRAYTQLVVKTCHARGAFAMGGMAAQIPIKDDPVKNEAALAKVTADKEREVKDGHDGTWVAHPGLVPLAQDIFRASLGQHHNQLHVTRSDVQTAASDLLAIPTGQRTLSGLDDNVRIGIAYMEAWLRGNGCVPLENLMEDAATAEISRSQIWQWLRHGAVLDDSIVMTEELLLATVEKETAKIETSFSETSRKNNRLEEAKNLFLQLCQSDTCADFLTTKAYEEILTLDSNNS